MEKVLGLFLRVASIIQRNANLPVTEISEQDRAQFTHKWMAAVSREILQIDTQNLAKFSAENCGPFSVPKLQRFFTNC